MGSPINNIGPMQIYRLINFAILLWPMQGFRSTAYLADTGPSRKYRWEFIGRPIRIYLRFIQNGPSWAFTIQTTKWHMGFIDNYGHFRQHGLRIVRLLIDHGADPYGRDNRNHLPYNIISNRSSTPNRSPNYAPAAPRSLPNMGSHSRV